jgi:endoglycosylceramidase
MSTRRSDQARRRTATRHTALLIAVLAMALTACSDDDADVGPNGTDQADTTTTSVAGTDDEALGAPWGQVAGTDGRHYIADEQGRALQFRGVNIKTAEPLEGANEELLDEIAARGFNHIRLSVYWNLAEPEQGQFDEQYLADVETAIERAAARDLWVIVDFHQDVFGEAFADNGMPEWATITNGASFEDTGSFLTNYLQPAVQEAWENLYEDPEIRAAQIDWYTNLADRVHDHPNILGYDLLNEPFGKIGDSEDFVAAAARVEQEQLTPMYQRLTDAIRTVDDQRWIFVEPPNLASLGIATSLGEIDDPRVVFYPHMYDANIEGETYNGDGNPESFDPAFFDQWTNAITTYTDRVAVPMMVGEWGLAMPENPGMEAFIAESLAVFEEVTSGWTQFTGCMGNSYCTFDEEGDDRPGIGQIVQPYATAVAGAPTSTRWVEDDLTLLVQFDDSGATGTTDVVIPEASRYPDGWRVETSDGDEAAVETVEGPDGIVRALVTTPETGGAHLICVVPEASTATCALP